MAHHGQLSSHVIFGELYTYRRGRRLAFFVGSRSGIWFVTFVLKDLLRFILAASRVEYRFSHFEAAAPISRQFALTEASQVPVLQSATDM